MTRPLIGVSTDLGAALWQDRIREAVLSPAAYGRAIERAGAVPVLLPPVLTGAAGRLCAGLDGLLLCGADAFEFALLQVALADGVPVLALARGLELLNVSQGGTLVAVPDGLVPAQTLGPGVGGTLAAVPDGPAPAQTQGPGAGPCAVRISPDSKLGAALGPAATVWPGRGLIPGRLGPGLAAVAWLRAEQAAG